MMHRVLPFLEVEGIPCERLLGHSSFKIKQMDRDGKRIHVQFESDVLSYSGGDHILGGSLWFLPESSWVIDEYRVTILPLSGTKSPVEMKMEWQNLDELPYPVEAKLTYHPKEGSISWVYQYADWRHEEDPPERFTLSYYGLPEPMGIKQPKPPRTWLWVLVAAIGAGLLATLFGWLKRRHAVSAAKA